LISVLDKLPSTVLQNDRVVKLRPYQDEFIFSQARYPAMVAAWGTGKSMCLIEKCKLACEQYPDNLGVIFRKEYTDLRDSTIKDFETYTGLKVNSSREVRIGSSLLMFRHLEEMNNIQNMNLGFFGIEQAEELDSDEMFFKLHGRLRRANIPHFGAVIANTKGHHWIYKLWKAKKIDGYHLVEAKTWDNQCNLPTVFINDLRKLKETKPKLYNRFVENSWEEEDTADRIISADKIREAEGRVFNYSIDAIRRCIGIDVARRGNDKTVMYALENGYILGKLELEKKDTMEVVGHALKFASENKNIDNFSVDELNAGAGVADRLKEIGKNVVFVNSAKASTNKKYRNIRAEVWGYGAEQFEKATVSMIKADDDLKEQLTWANWKDIDSSGVLQVEKKEDIIERYGRSPDNADAYLYGIWGMKFFKPIYVDQYNPSFNNGAYIPLKTF